MSEECSCSMDGYVAPTNQLIELSLDPLDGVLDLGYDDELESIYSTVGDLDHTLDGNELSLERSNLDQELEISCEAIFCFHDGLTTTCHADHRVVIAVADATEVEGWLLHTGNVLGGDSDSNVGLGLHTVSYSHTEISSCEVSVCHFKLALIKIFSHSLFCLDNPFHDLIECLFECVRLLFE